MLPFLHNRNSVVFNTLVGQKNARIEVIFRGCKYYAGSLMKTVTFRGYDKSTFQADWDMINLINSGQVRIKSDGQMDLRYAPKRFNKHMWHYTPDKFELFYRGDIAAIVGRGIAPTADYEKFKTDSSNLLAQLVSYLLGRVYPQLIENMSEVKVQLIIFDSYYGGEYSEGTVAFYDNELRDIRLIKMGEEHFKDKGYILLFLSGSLLLGRVFAPWVYTQKLDFSIIDKCISHEIQHYSQDLRGLISYEDQVKNRILKMGQFLGQSGQIWKGGVRVLYEIFWNMHDDGVATFAEGKYRSSVIFDLNKIEKEKLVLDKIADISDQDKAEVWWDTKFTPDSRSGEYYMGMLMCYFIGLSIWVKQKKRNYIMISTNNGKKEMLPISQLNVYLNTKRIAYLENLPADVFNATYSLLNGITQHRQFLDLYKEACTGLGITKPVMFLDYDYLYNYLIKKARQHSKSF